MVHRNRRGLDVAHSLANMVQFPDVNEVGNTNTQTQQPNQQSRSINRLQNQRPIGVAGSVNNRNGAPARRYPQLMPANHAPLRYRAQDPVPMNMNHGDQNLQSHLIRQQIIAGVAPENIMTINQRQPQANGSTQCTPSLVQITNEGVSFPCISPATFIPRTPYPNPPGNWNEENTGHNTRPRHHEQFLDVPNVGPQPAFERHPTAFTWGSIGWRHPAHPPPAPIGMNTSSIDARAENPYGYQSSPSNTLTSTLNPNASGYGGAPVVKSEADMDHGQHHMPPYPIPASDGRFPVGINNQSHHFSTLPKTEPDVDQILQSIPDYPIPTLGGEFSGETTGHTHDFPVVPKNETNVDEVLQSVSNYPIPNLDDGFPGGMNGHAHGCPVVPKSELGVGQAQLGMSGYPFLDFGSGFPTGLDDHTHAPPTIPRTTLEHGFTSPESHGMGRTPRPYTSQACRPMNTGVGQARAQNVTDPIQWQPTPAVELATSRLPSAAPEDENNQNSAKEDTAPTINILHAIITHPDIALQITGELGIKDLINLQTTSKACCTFTVKYLPKIVRLQALHRSRAACQIFPWRCYQKLWFKRPVLDYDAQRLSGFHPNNPVTAYTVSFRWLQMVRSRDETVHSIINALTNAGYGFPYRYKPVIFKLWFLMDIPDMSRRLWTIQNRNLWTDLDLFIATLFIIRIDLYVKTVRGNTSGGQRRLIMAQRGLKFCLDVLTGNTLRNEMELLKELVRWRYNPLPGEILLGDVFGVPAAEVGSLQYEYYGEGRRDRKLQRPDEIVLLETRRRQLDLNDMYQRIFLYAQPQEFTACERPNSFWDEEVKRAVRNPDALTQDLLRLD